MNRLFVFFFLLGGLSGCAKDQNAFYIAPVPAELGNSLAADAIKQLQAQYLPARTTFNIGQPVTQTDSFGTSLVFAMRQKGYAVQEYSPTQAAEPLSRLSLRYTIDRPASSLIAGLYRVQLRVGKATFTRAYTSENSTANPAGAWAKME